jgi:hypothetical protein
LRNGLNAFSEYLDARFVCICSRSMLFGALSWVVLALGSAQIPELKWITPGGYSWGQVDPNANSDLLLEVESESIISDTPLFVEYRIDSHDSDASWTRFSASSARRSRAGSTHWDGSIARSVIPAQAGIHYLEARVSDGVAQGPSSAVLYAVSPVDNLSATATPLNAWTNSKVRQSAASVFSGQLEGLGFLSSASPFARIEYSVANSGVWQHLGDFPNGKVNVELPFSAFSDPVTEGGEIPIRFRAFNGVSWTPHTDQPVITTVVNSRPMLSVLDSHPGVLSVVPGENVTLAVRITDADNDRLHVMCLFDGGAKLMTSSHDGGDQVVLPPSAFAGQLRPGEHTLEVFAFDGYDISRKSFAVAYVVNGNSDDEEMEDFTPVAIAGIAVGGVALVAVVAAVVVLARKGMSANIPE